MKDQEDYIFNLLMTNKDFRDWVINPTEHRNHYWEKWAEVNKEYKELSNKARNAILKLKFRESFLEEEKLEDILTRIISNETPKVHSKSNQGSNFGFGKWFFIAASVMILTVAGFVTSSLVQNGYFTSPVVVKKIFNPEGRKSKFKLPDGSIVYLNAGSTLRFPEVFEGESRQVELNGEAYFEVSRDEKRPFIVNTRHLKTKVLGTTFNVRAYEEDADVDVALVTGKVVVEGVHAKGDAYVLEPGEKLRYHKSTVSSQKSRFNLTEEIGWKDEILVFSNADFQSFVTLLERWYGVKIKVLAAPNKRWNVNGHFERESLEELLMGVQFTHGIGYEIQGKKVTLKCK